MQEYNCENNIFENFTELQKQLYISFTSQSHYHKLQSLKNKSVGRMSVHKDCLTLAEYWVAVQILSADHRPNYNLTVVIFLAKPRPFLPENLSSHL